MLALEDAKLVPHPPEPRGNLEETRLDVVDVAVEHPAIQHPVRENHKAAGAEDAVGVPTPEPARRAYAFGIL